MPVLAAAPLSAAVAGGSMVQQLIQQQMQLMSQQLALLGGAAGAAMPAGPAAAPAHGRVTPVVAAVPPGSAAVCHRRRRGSATGHLRRQEGVRRDRPHPHQAGALDEQQRARLDAFIRRYTDSTKAARPTPRAPPAHGRPARRQRLPPADQGDHLPDRGRAAARARACGTSTATSTSTC